MSSSAARYFPGAFGKGISSDRTDALDPQAMAAEPATEKSLEQSNPAAANLGPATGTVTSLAVPSDGALMARICDGDKEALAFLFRRYSRVVRAVAYRVLRDGSEADDLVQDIFLLVHRDCATFDSSKGSARFWILQMTYRRAVSRRRYLTSRHFYTRLDLDDVPDELVDPRTGASEIERSIDGKFGNSTLKKVCEDLSENQRQTLDLFFMDGCTFDEIAAKLGQSRGNVKHHYFRGLERLRKELFGSKLPGERAI